MIRNISKKNVVVENVKYCKGLSKYVGLMFSRKIENKALIFEFKREQISAIHMFFVFYPIDLIFLNENKKVVEIKENLKPFNFYTPKNKAKYVIELSAGSVKKTKTVIGDKLRF